MTINQKIFRKNQLIYFIFFSDILTSVGMKLYAVVALFLIGVIPVKITQSELHWGAKGSGKQDECNAFETIAENAECPFQLILYLHNEAAKYQGSGEGTYILNDDKVNGKSYWSGPNGNAIWHIKDFNVWVIGPSQYLGSNSAFLVLNFIAQCPHQGNDNWKFADGINWLDAENDVQIEMMDTGLLSKLFNHI